MKVIKFQINNIKNSFRSAITILLITTFFFQHFSSKCQNLPGTLSSATGFNLVPTGWYNASTLGGTPDLSTCAFAIFPFCFWNTSSTNYSPTMLPTPPTGDSIFCDLWTATEAIGTTITNLVVNNNYTIKVYLLAAVSSYASTNLPGSPFIYFPSSIDVSIGGVTSVVQLDSSMHNRWKLISFTFTANSTTEIFKIGNPKPYITGPNGGGGFVCISIASNSISCSNYNFLGPDRILCLGDTLNIDAGFSNAGYLWQDGSTNSNYIVTAPGTYAVSVSQSNCWAVDSINISYKPLPTVKLGEDVKICFGNKLFLDITTPGGSYLWQDGSVNAHYSITQQGIYWAKLTVDGCENSDTINVEVIDCDCKLSVPNAFTPNGDGINDKWVLSQRNCISKIALSVYNMYGSLIYHSNDYRNDWQGTYRSLPCPDGTYYYIINFNRSNHTEQTLKGNVTILR